MSHAGRKPINRELLHGYAAQWACLLYSIRDGCPGFIMPAGPSLKERGGLPTQKPRPEDEQKGIIRLTATEFKIPQEAIITFPPRRDRKRIEQALQTTLKNPENTFHYIYVPSVQPDCEIWNRLKEAKTTEQVEEIFAKARQWALAIRAPFISRGTDNTTLVTDAPKSKTHARATAREALKEGRVAGWPLLPFLVSGDWPGKILAAKRLWTYPRTDRPKSDDKRIIFFAKSLAAITLEKSPATATARWLSDWHWPKDWYAGSIAGRMKAVR